MSDSILIRIFLAFLIPNVIAYGGGPAMIPIIEDQTVNYFDLINAQVFSNTFAIGSALPSPIATKMAGYIGYYVSGWSGMLVALCATVIPTSIAMIIASKVLTKYKDSPYIKSMAKYILPIITSLMVLLSYKLSIYAESNMIHFVILFIVSAIGLQRLKIAPIYMILMAIVYGAIFIN